MPDTPATPSSFHALYVKQWHDAWEPLNYDSAQNQAKPRPGFYMFSMPARRLRSLSGIYRRSTEETTPRGEDLGIQRRHDSDRSAEISRYVVGGYPWSTLSERKREDASNDKLRKPGWLPTAVVVNLLQPGDQRDGRTVALGQEVSVGPTIDGLATLAIPTTFDLPPVEVIDGQHRLFAFADTISDTDDDYELPVVAFVGLDIAWQAYLFWTINIKPKKINPSLAFDLYPLLREQDWLESGEVLGVYKESRAQELTEVLWSTPESPWFRRINMLGGTRKENGPVSQAAFIRSLVATMVKSWKSPRASIGGVFGGTPNSHEGLAWSRLQQAAFLVECWRLLADAVLASDAAWATEMKDFHSSLLEPFTETNSAFEGQFSLLATDQGVRGYLYVVNDICYLLHDELALRNWTDDLGFADMTPSNVSVTMDSLRAQPVHATLSEIAQQLASFDWRTSAFPGLSTEDQLAKASLRGSSGYREIRKQLLAHISNVSSGSLKRAAAEAAAV